MEQNIHRAHASGANSLIQKPVDADKFGEIAGLSSDTDCPSIHMPQWQAPAKKKTLRIKQSLMEIFMNERLYHNTCDVRLGRKPHVAMDKIRA